MRGFLYENQWQCCETSCSLQYHSFAHWIWPAGSSLILSLTRLYEGSNPFPPCNPGDLLYWKTPYFWISHDTSLKTLCTCSWNLPLLLLLPAPACTACCYLCCRRLLWCAKRRNLIGPDSAAATAVWTSAAWTSNWHVILLSNFGYLKISKVNWFVFPESRDYN